MIPGRYPSGIRGKKKKKRQGVSKAKMPTRVHQITIPQMPPKALGESFHVYIVGM
jgi:hypothetical protein